MIFLHQKEKIVSLRDIFIWKVESVSQPILKKESSNVSRQLDALLKARYFLATFA